LILIFLFNLERCLMANHLHYHFLCVLNHSLINWWLLTLMFCHADFLLNNPLHVNFLHNLYSRPMHFYLIISFLINCFCFECFIFLCNVKFHFNLAVQENSIWSKLTDAVILLTCTQEVNIFSCSCDIDCRDWCFSWCSSGPADKYYYNKSLMH